MLFFAVWHYLEQQIWCVRQSFSLIAFCLFWQAYRQHEGKCPLYQCLNRLALKNVDVIRFATYYGRVNGRALQNHQKKTTVEALLKRSDRAVAEMNRSRKQWQAEREAQGNLGGASWHARTDAPAAYSVFEESQNAFYRTMMLAWQARIVAMIAGLITRIKHVFSLTGPMRAVEYVSPPPLEQRPSVQPNSPNTSN